MPCSTVARLKATVEPRPAEEIPVRREERATNRASLGVGESDQLGLDLSQILDVSAGSDRLASGTGVGVSLGLGRLVGLSLLDRAFLASVASRASGRGFGLTGLAGLADAARAVSHSRNAERPGLSCAPSTAWSLPAAAEEVSEESAEGRERRLLARLTGLSRLARIDDANGRLGSLSRGLSAADVAAAADALSERGRAERERQGERADEQN